MTDLHCWRAYVAAKFFTRNNELTLLVLGRGLNSVSAFLSKIIIVIVTVIVNDVNTDDNTDVGPTDDGDTDVSLVRAVFIRHRQSEDGSVASRCVVAD